MDNQLTCCISANDFLKIARKKIAGVFYTPTILSIYSSMSNTYFTLTSITFRHINNYLVYLSMTVMIRLISSGFAT